MAKPEDNAFLTKISLVYLESTGWYEYNKNYKRNTNWGLRASCSMFGTTSETHCKEALQEQGTALGSARCSADYISKAVVELAEADDYFEFCKILRPKNLVSTSSPHCTSNQVSLDPGAANSYLQERYGATSRCFMARYRNKGINFTDFQAPYQPVCQTSRVIFC